MILERTRELVINLGNNTYESARISARVVLDTDNAEDNDKVGVLAAGGSTLNLRNSDYAHAADKILSAALEDEVEYWHEITTKKDSFIHLVNKDNEERNTKNA